MGEQEESPTVSTQRGIEGWAGRSCSGQAGRQGWGWGGGGGEGKAWVPELSHGLGGPSQRGSVPHEAAIS